MKKSYWHQGCKDGKAGKPSDPSLKLAAGYTNGYTFGKEIREMENLRKANLKNRIPDKEESALRFAFEKSMAEAFGLTNFLRDANGYQNATLQTAWFACRCGWLTGNSSK